MNHRLRSATRAVSLLFVLVPLAVPGTADGAFTVRDERPANALTISAQPFNIIANTSGRFLVQAPPEFQGVRGARLEFSLHRRVSSREPFIAIANGVVDTAVIDEISFALSAVARENGLLAPTVPIVINGSSPRSLTVRYEGVYPLSVRIVDAVSRKELASTMTFLYRRDAVVTRDPVAITPLVNVIASPSFAPTGEVSITQDSRETITNAIEYLTSVRSPAIINVQPELLTAFAVSDEGEDAALLEEFRAVLRGRSVASTTFSPTDPAWLGSNGLGAEFFEQVALGRDTLRRLLPESIINETAWVSNRPLNREAVSLLRKAGFASIVILAAARGGLDSQAPHSIISHASDMSGTPVVVIGADSAVSELMSVKSSSPQQLGFRIAAETLVEIHDLLVAGFDPSRIRFVLASPSGLVFDVPTMRSATQALAGSPGISLSGITDATEWGDQPSATVFPADKANGERNRIASLRSARSDLNAASSMLSDSDPRREVWSYLLGIGASSMTADPNDFVNGLRNDIGQTLDSISVSTQGNINLSSRRGSIRIQVRNDSAADLTVRITVSSTKLRIDQPSRIVQLAAGTTTDVKVDATTRTNGRFPVSVRILTPSGGLRIVPPITITAKVSAIAGFGQLISISLLLVTIAWWWSHRRKSGGEEQGIGSRESTVSNQ